MLLVHWTVPPSNMQTWSVCGIQNRNIAVTVIRSEFKRIRSSLRLFLKEFTSLELEANLQCQLKGKPGGLKEANNNSNLCWLLVVKRNKGSLLQIVKSVRSLRETHGLETLLSTFAFNKTLVYCKAKLNCWVPWLSHPPSPPKQLSLQAGTLSVWNIFGRKTDNNGAEPALIWLNSVFLKLHLPVFNLFSLGFLFPSSCHTGAPCSTPCF